MSILDELKKTGLANAKKAKQIEKEKKQQQHRELKEGTTAPQPAPKVSAETLALENKRLLEIQEKEHLQRVYCGAALGDVAGRKRFYFRTFDRFLDVLMLSDVAVALLERGKYAIVADAALDEHIVVKRATALLIEAIDKKRVVFFVRQEN